MFFVKELIFVNRPYWHAWQVVVGRGFTPAENAYWKKDGGSKPPPYGKVRWAYPLPRHIICLNQFT